MKITGEKISIDVVVIGIHGTGVNKTVEVEIMMDGFVKTETLICSKSPGDNPPLELADDLFIGLGKDQYRPDDVDMFYKAAARYKLKSI